MRWTQTLIPTSRENPSDASTASHQLLLRAGLMRQVSSESYSLLPLGLRALQKATAIVRDELTPLGALEIRLPEPRALSLHAMAAKTLGITSYRQLPITLFQFSSDSPDPSTTALLRSIDPWCAHVFGFHATAASAQDGYTAVMRSLQRILQRCDIPFEVAQDAVAPHTVHALLCPCPAGGDVLLRSDKGNFAATLRACPAAGRPYDLGGQPHGDLEKVHTPGSHTIEEVSSFLGVRADFVLKTVIYQAGPAREGAFAPKWIVAVVRGDHEVNEGKLAAAAAAFNAGWISLSDNDELRSRFAVGYVGPDAAMREYHAVLIIDPDAAQDRAWVAGANEIDYHVRHFNWFRDAGDRLADPTKTLVADIRNARPGEPSPLADGGVLQETRGVLLAHLRDYGSKPDISTTYVDEAGARRETITCGYRLDLTGLLLAAIEMHHDDHGIIWPAALAPYSVCITPIRYEGETREVADRLHDELNSAGIDTILDDRDARPGYKFADADLVGFPIRINVGDRGLREGKVEMKRRDRADLRLVTVADALAEARSILQPRSF